MTREERITEIVDRLSSLTLEAQELTQELKDLRAPPDVNPRTRVPNTSTLHPTHDHGFTEGNRVVIRNGYKGARGTQGIVIFTTKQQVTLQDGRGKTHTRKYSNLTRVS